MLDFCQLISRMGRIQSHMPQAVEDCNLLRRLIHQTLGDVGFRVNHYMDTPVLGGYVRSDDSRLR